MPTVPRVIGQQVNEQPLQAPLQRSSASPALLAGNTGQQLSEAGRALIDAGFVLQERADADTVLRSTAKLTEQFLPWEAEAKQRKGQAAIGVAKEATAFIDEAAGAISKDLSNPRQQAIFAQSVAKLRTQALGTFGDHEAAQRRISLDDSAQAQIVTLTNYAAANPLNPEILASTRADTIKASAARAQLNGWSPELAQAKLAQDLTSRHKQVLQALVKDYPEQAQAYFEANKGEINGSEHAEIGAFAAKATATRLGENAATALWSELGPKGDRSPVQLDVMEDRIRKDGSLSDEAKKVGIAGLRERAAAFKDGRRERDDQLEGAVNQALMDGKPLAEIRRMPEFLALSPESARKIGDYAETQALRREQRAQAREARLDAAESREQRRLARYGMGAYMVYSDPATLATMSRTQVINLLPSLGNDLTNHLLAKHDALSNPAKLTEAKMDQDDFNHVGRQMGLPIDKVTKTEEDKARIGEAHFRVEQRLAAVQQQVGKVLSRDEKMAVVRQELARTVTVDTWGWNNEQVPVIALSPEQVKKVLIPASERPKIADAMRIMHNRTGLPQYAPTDENLRRFYLLSKSPTAAFIPPAKD